MDIHDQDAKEYILYNRRKDGMKDGQKKAVSCPQTSSGSRTTHVVMLWLIQSRTVVWCSPGQEKEGAEGPNVVLSTRASWYRQRKSSSNGEVLPGAPFLLASNWCVGLQSGVQSVWVHWIPAQEWLS